MNYIKIAQRNLWRNKRRTIITISSILFAVFFAVVMRSFQLGSYSLMIRNAIEAYSGYLRIQHPDYADDPLLENTIEYNDTIQKFIGGIPNVKAVTPRLETFALASSGNITKGVVVLGIDPESEKKFSNPENFLARYIISASSLNKLKQMEKIPQDIYSKCEKLKGYTFTDSLKLISAVGINPNEISLVKSVSQIFRHQGNFLSENDSGVVVSYKLSQYLNIGVGDSLILLGQGYQGTSAAGIYRIKGIVRLSNPDLDNKVVYMPLNVAQQFTGAYNRIAYWAINLKDSKDKAMLRTQSELSKYFSSATLTVKNWKELNRVLVQQIDGDNQSGKAFLVLLYFVVFFGIFGTVIMMIHERIHEFGVLVSVGMQKKRLAILVFLEMFLIAIIGVFVGLGLSIPLIYYYNIHPIRLTGEMAKMMMDMGFEPLMPMSTFDLYVVWQGVVVILMVLIACIYPLRRIFKLKETEALRR